MAKIVWSDNAVEDLREIYVYLSRSSPAYADRVVNRMGERINILETHEQVGRIVREFNNPNIRELLESGYRIVYRIEIGNEISIARIWRSDSSLITL